MVGAYLLLYNMSLESEPKGQFETLPDIPLLILLASAVQANLQADIWCGQITFLDGGLDGDCLNI